MHIINAHAYKCKHFFSILKYYFDHCVEKWLQCWKGQNKFSLLHLSTWEMKVTCTKVIVLEMVRSGEFVHTTKDVDE